MLGRLKCFTHSNAGGLIPVAEKAQRIRVVSDLQMPHHRTELKSNGKFLRRKQPL
jgi:hypothetical protein